MSMTNFPHIVGLGGSLSEKSTSLAALRLALAGAEAEGASSEAFSIRDMNLPMYDAALAVPDEVNRLADAVERSQGMIWSSPLYHGSVSGAFKNAVDWLQVLVARDVPYLQGKVVGLLATAGGVQGLNAINAMEFSVRGLRGYAVPLVLPISQASQVFDDQLNVTDDRIGQQLTKLGEEVARAARQVSDSGTCDYAEHAKLHEAAAT